MLEAATEDPQKRQCFHCKNQFPNDCFHKGSYGRTYSYCKKCTSIKNTKWADKNRDKIAKKCSKWHYNKFYGITPDDAASIHLALGGVCEICLTKTTLGGRVKKGSSVIDHNHKTGEMRGMICAQCNHGLGLFKDSPLALRSAAAYLEMTDNISLVKRVKVLKTRTYG